MSHDSHRMDDASLSAFARHGPMAAAHSRSVIGAVGVRCPVSGETVRLCKASKK